MGFESPIGLRGKSKKLVPKLQTKDHTKEYYLKSERVVQKNEEDARGINVQDCIWGETYLSFFLPKEQR